MSNYQIEAHIASLQRRGFPLEKAERYAAYIGDTPEEDAQGYVIRDGTGAVIDHVPITSRRDAESAEDRQ